MRILLLTQLLPYPPDSGPKVKTYNVLRYLAQRHQVHLVSFARSAGEAAGASALAGLCATVTTIPLPSPLPPPSAAINIPLETQRRSPGVSPHRYQR